MKSRKVKSANKRKLYLSKKKQKPDIPLESGSGSDVDSDSYYHDEIDDFHQKEDEKLSTDDELIQYDDDTSEEEEVLPITDDEKDEVSDQNEADIDEDDENEGLPNLEAWGRKKSMYYNADFVDEDRGRTYREEDAEAAKAEAEEAFAIQKNIFSNITTSNLGADLLLEGSAESSGAEEGEEEDKFQSLASATKQEKLKFLRRTSPEFFAFIREFKEKMSEVKNRIEPLLSFIAKRNVLSEASVNYVKLKYQLLLHYCLNISFYMVLKSNGTLVANHPVIQRITSYKNLLDKLQNMDKNVIDDIDIILMKLENNEEIKFKNGEPDNAVDEIKEQSGRIIENGIEEEEKKEKKRKFRVLDTEAEKEVISMYMNVKEQHKKKLKSPSGDEMEVSENVTTALSADTPEEKRNITYEIAKNKGLIPRRKKEYRNPRVRHRMKFRKAKIRRKGQVREATREIKKYEGEKTGISAYVVKSIKLK